MTYKVFGAWDVKPYTQSINLAKGFQGFSARLPMSAWSGASFRLHPARRRLQYPRRQ